MTFQLPPRKHFVHKAIEPRNLSPKVLAAADARQDDYWEVKYDGCCGMLIKAKGKAYAFSRQGEPVNGALDRQLRAMESLAHDNYVLFVEGWAANLIHSDINGAFRRGYGDDEPRVLESVIWDMVPLDTFMAGKGGLSYSTRSYEVDTVLFALRNFGFGHIFRKAFQAKSKLACESYIDSCREGRGEIFAVDGFMRKASAGVWNAGAGSCGTILKDKELLTVDLKVDGLVEGKGKFVGMLGAFECTYNGKPQLVGGGTLTDKQRLAIWNDKATVDGGIGSIIEVHALGESTNGLLREPRFYCVRYDKTEGE